MLRRLRIYRQQTGIEDRIRLAALVLFPLWVTHFPLMRFVLPAWCLGLILPLALQSPLRQRPRLSSALPLMLWASSLAAIFGLEFYQSAAAVQMGCRWLWFCLAFAAGHEFWTLSDPVAEEQRVLANQLRGLHERMDEALATLRKELERQGEDARTDNGS